MNSRNFRHEARDDYLEAILQITQARSFCRSIDIAEELNVSKPSVSVAVGKLMAGGLVEMDEDKLLHLTERGQDLAELTYAKHRYFRTALKKLGVDPETAEREACAVEHAISAETFRKIREKYPLEE